MAPVRMGSSRGHTKLQPALTHKGDGLMFLEMSWNQMTSQGTEIWAYNLFLTQLFHRIGKTGDQSCGAQWRTWRSKVKVENCWKWPAVSRPILCNKLLNAPTWIFSNKCLRRQTRREKVELVLIKSQIMTFKGKQGSLEEDLPILQEYQVVCNCQPKKPSLFPLSCPLLTVCRLKAVQRSKIIPQHFRFLHVESI